MPTRVRWDPAKHPRGPLGRFIDTSGSARTWSAQERPTPWRDYDSGRLWEVEDGYRFDDLDEDFQEAARDYVQGSQFLNARLRNGMHTNGVDELDWMMDTHKLREDTTVYRGIEGDIFGAVEPGDQIVDFGFTSTSLDPRVAEDFSDDDGDRMEIRLPAGTHFYPMSTVDLDFEQQLELTLPRGAVFEVRSVQRTRPDGRDLVVELVGYVDRD